jgi:small subunit ribosomal protein S6
MLKNYELLYIVHPDLEGSTDKVNEKVAGFIKKVGGEITSQEDWGKRKLAYKIAKNDFGVYVLVNFSAESSNLHEIERDLRLSEEIMRSMVTAAIEESEVEAKKPTKKTEKKAETKKEEPASIIVTDEEEKPKKATKKAAEKTEAVAEEVKEEKAKPAKKAAVKKAENPEDEAERLKKIDEKLDELLK